MEYSYIDGESYLDLLYKINEKISIGNQDREELSYQLWEIIIGSLYQTYSFGLRPHACINPTQERMRQSKVCRKNLTKQAEFVALKTNLF